MKAIQDNTLSGLIAEIECRQYEHIVLLVGSVVSGVGTSACATVPTVRNHLVLQPLMDRFRAASATGDDVAATAILTMMTTDGHALSQAVADLPFELFMSCLDFVAPDCAHEIIRLACCDRDSFSPNFNHRALARLAIALCARQFAASTTVLTTNYDLGLEAAWAEMPNVTRERIHEAPFPAYWMVQGGRRLRYGKLHGCIRHRDSLVYTFEKLAEGMLRPEKLANTLAEWFPPTARTLVLSFGYGYNDPDLRPVWRNLFPRTHVRVCRTERFQVNADVTSEPDRLLGTDVLRQETFDEFDLTTLRTDLFADDCANAAIHLATSLAGVAPIRDDSEPSKFPVEQAAQQAAAILDRMNAAQVVHFLAALVDACYRADIRAVLHRLVQEADQNTLRPEVVELYLKQFGHGHELSALTVAAREVRARWRSPDVRVLCDAFTSFALSLDVRQSPLTRLFGPAKSLVLARLALKSCTPRTRSVFHHYHGHFWLKLLQYGEAKLPVFLLPLYRHGARQAARWLILPFAEARQFGVAQCDARLVAEAGNLEAQVWILAGDPVQAHTTAVRAQVLCSAQNALHVVLQCDRTVAWALLASGQPDDVFRAWRVLARGLVRAMHAADPSLRRKLGLNFLRVTFHLTKRRWALEDVAPAKANRNAVLTALHALLSIQHAGEISPDAFATVAADVLATCTDPERAKSHLRRYADVAMYPVLLLEE